MNQRIIINSDVLSSSYLPKKLIFRVEEFEHLRRNISNQVNTILIGPTGSGKTSLIKKIMADIPEEDIRYVNCTIYDTQFSVLKELLPSAKLIVLRSVYELIKRLDQEAKIRKIWTCFDNFTRLKDVEVIRKIMEIGVNIIIVSNVKKNLRVLNQNTLSNIPQVISLTNYTPEQSYEILKRRAETALTESSFTEDLLKTISNRTKGNMMLALNMLRSAALKVESERRKIIEVADLSEQLQNIDEETRLDADEQLLYNIVKEKERIASGELYAIYKQHAFPSKGGRAFRNYMQSLCLKGLVRAIGDRRGRIYEIVKVQDNDETFQ